MRLPSPTQQFPSAPTAQESLPKYVISRRPVLFETIRAESTLKVTRDDYEGLRSALDEFGDSGFEVDFEGEEVFISVPTGPVDFDRDKLPSRCFLSRLGALIANNGLEFLEFAVAWWSDDPFGPGGAGVTCFRVMRDGSVRYPQLTWPCDDTDAGDRR